jgi:hypothetical protein
MRSSKKYSKLAKRNLDTSKNWIAQKELIINP